MYRLRGLPTELATCDGMGARLQQLRVERGHTKAASARLVGLSPSTVADIEYGAQTGVEVIEALAKALYISPAWLAFNQGSRELPVRRRAVTESESAQASD
jgi:transcriptional regulator with XRE-family HTH domain